MQSAQFAMGTVITHQVFGAHAREALSAAEAEVARLEGLLSRFLPSSEISEINRNAGAQSVQVGAETYQVLSEAADYSASCGGLFDVTVGPLVSLWQRSGEDSRPPEEAEIKWAMALVDYADLMLDPDDRTARLRREGQSVDLGGFGKGFAGDRVLDVHREHGIFSAFINLGGNVAAMGTKPDGSPWRVGIRHPRKEDELLGLVSVADKAVVTSGDYQRCFFDRDGRRHHHILDPSTGRPSESGLSSVTIVADSSSAADALSTIVFVAGLEKGLGFVRARPGAEAVLVDGACRVYVTRGLAGCFECADGTDAVLV